MGRSEWGHVMSRHRMRSKRQQLVTLRAEVTAGVEQARRGGTHEAAEVFARVKSRQEHPSAAPTPFARAIDALGSAEKADRWMRKPDRALAGQRPIDLLGSEEGTRVVDDALGRLRHGVAP